MNQVLSLVRLARESAQPFPGNYSDHMLSELLALHEDMIAQLRRERVELTDSGEFILGMIAQHKESAAKLRALLENHESRIPWETPVFAEIIPLSKIPQESAGGPAAVHA
jgi:hypothetical protein